MPSTTTAEKAELRRRARQYLSGLSPQARRTSDDALFARFLALPQVEAADTLLLYHGMGGEPDTARLLPALWARGKAVCLPRCLPGHGMEARLVRPDSALIPHPYGMLEPGEDCPLVGKDAIGLVLVPGLAFDPSGGRLGQGGGFYDRWLADYAGCTAALCRTALLLPQVPRAPHDRGVELVLTEHGLYRADAQRSGAADGGDILDILRFIGHDRACAACQQNIGDIVYRNVICDVVYERGCFSDIVKTSA